MLDAANVENDTRHYQQKTRKEYTVAAGKWGKSCRNED